MSGPSLPPDPVLQPGRDLPGLPCPVHEDRGWGDADPDKAPGKESWSHRQGFCHSTEYKEGQGQEMRGGGCGGHRFGNEASPESGSREDGPGAGQIPAGIRDLVVAHLCQERKKRNFVSVFLEWPTWVVVLLESGLTRPHSTKTGQRAQATQWGKVAPEWVGPWRNDSSGASRSQQRGSQKVRSHLPPLKLYMATTPPLQVKKKKKRLFLCVW